MYSNYKEYKGVQDLRSVPFFNNHLQPVLLQSILWKLSLILRLNNIPDSV